MDSAYEPLVEENNGTVSPENVLLKTVDPAPAATAAPPAAAPVSPPNPPTATAAPANSPPEAAAADKPLRPNAPVTGGPLRLGSVANAITNARARGLGAKTGPATPAQQRAAGEGVLKRAMRSASGRLSAKSLTSAKARLGKAAKATRRFLVTGNFVGEVIIAGERVRLDERNFNPDRFYDVVSFHEMYFPGRSDSTALTKEKEVFTRVFGDGAPIDPNTQAPSLPCSGEEASILLEGLLNRFERLRNDTVLLYEQVGDTADVRARIDHAQRLKLFIDTLQQSKEDGKCIDFKDLSAVSGKDVQTEEEIRELLRQFAFMILQARSPVPEYADRTKIVQDFIDELRRDPVSEEEMNAFLVLWKEQAIAKGDPEGIPAILGEVLDTTSTQKGVLDMMLEDRLEALYSMIVKEVRDNYSVDGVPPPLLIEFNEFLDTELGPRLGEMSPQEKVVAVVKQLVKMNLTCWESYKEKEGIVTSLEAQKKDLEAKLAEALTNLEQLRTDGSESFSAAVEAQEEVTRLKGEVATLQGTLAAEKEGRAADAKTAAAQIADAEQAAVRIQSNLKAVEASLEEAKKTEALAEAAVVAAVTTQEAAVAALTEEKAKHDALKEEHTKLNETYKTLLEQKTAADAELNTIRAQLAGAQEALNVAQAGTTDSQRETAEKAEKIAALESQIESLKTAATEAESQQKQLRQQIDKCGAAMQQQGVDMSSLRDKMATQEAKAAEQIGHARAAEAQSKEQLESVQREATTNAATLREAFARVDSLNTEIKAARQQLNEATTQLAALQAAVTRGEEEKAAAKTAAEAEARKLEAQLAVLEQESKTATEELTAALADRDAAVRDMTTRLQAAEGREAGLRADVQQARSTLARKTSEFESALAQAETGKATSVEGAKQTTAKLADELEQLRASIKAKTDELAKVILERETMETELTGQVEASQKATAAAVRGETAAEGRAELLQKKAMEQLQALAQNVLDGKMTLPEEAAKSTLAPAFNSLLENVRVANERAKEAGVAAAAASNPDAKFNTSTQICFMTHFITFFVKTLFFTQDNREVRSSLYDTLNVYVDAALAKYTEAHEEERDAKYILYRMLSAAFSLLYAGETLYMNKQTLRESEFPAKSFVGLHVLKQDAPEGGPDPQRIELVRLLWDTWKEIGSSDVKEKVNTSVQSVFGQILLLVPSVHFNPPMEKTGKDTLRVMSLLHEYPSLSFVPTESKMPTALGVQTYTEVDIDNGFTMRQRNLVEELRELAPTAIASQQAWPLAVKQTIHNKVLSFADLFCIFVVLGRRYLMEIRADLARFKCPLPSFLAERGKQEVEEVLAADTADMGRLRGTLFKRQEPAPEPAPAPAPAPAPPPVVQQPCYYQRTGSTCSAPSYNQCPSGSRCNYVSTNGSYVQTGVCVSAPRGDCIDNEAPAPDPVACYYASTGAECSAPNYNQCPSGSRCNYVRRNGSHANKGICVSAPRGDCIDNVWP